MKNTKRLSLTVEEEQRICVRTVSVFRTAELLTKFIWKLPMRMAIRTLVEIT